MNCFLPCKIINGACYNSSAHICLRKCQNKKRQTNLNYDNLKKIKKEQQQKSKQKI